MSEVWSKERSIARLCKENGWLMPQKPQTPQRLSAKHLLRPGKGAAYRVGDQLVHNSLIDGEITGWLIEHHQS